MLELAKCRAHVFTRVSKSSMDDIEVQVASWLRSKAEGYKDRTDYPVKPSAALPGSPPIINYTAVTAKLKEAGYSTKLAPFCEVDIRAWIKAKIMSLPSKGKTIEL